MKTVLGLLLIWGMASAASAACVGEVKDVRIDVDRGSIIVETQYTLNGTVVDVKGGACPTCLGQSRYLRQQGTKAEIVALAKSDISEHCEALIKRIPVNKTFLKSEMVKQQKALNDTILSDIQANAIGFKITKTEATVSFQGKDIKVTDDSTNTVTDTP